MPTKKAIKYIGVVYVIVAIGSTKIKKLAE